MEKHKIVIEISAFGERSSWGPLFLAPKYDERAEDPVLEVSFGSSESNLVLKIEATVDGKPVYLCRLKD